MKDTNISSQKVHPYAISIDWLQVYCHVDNPNIEEFTPLFCSQFEIVKMPHGTRQFKNVYEVYMSDRQPNTPKTSLNNPIKHNGNYNILYNKRFPYNIHLFNAVPLSCISPLSLGLFAGAH